jgi:NDP-sugar pyrophosphorylase family protein
VLVVSPSDDEIQAHFSDPAKFGADSIHFAEQTERLGTAHALSLAVPFIQDDFVLTACDNMVPADHIGALLQTFRGQQANGVLSLMEIDPQKTASTGIVEWHAGRVTRIVEKPLPEDAPSNISSLPLYLYSSKLLPHLAQVQPSPRGEYELQDAIQALIDFDGGVTGVLTPSRRQLTNVNDLLALNNYFLDAEASQADIHAAEIGPGTEIVMRAQIAEGVTIGHSCVIGPNVSIEEGCRIGDRVCIEGSIVLRDSLISSDSQIVDQVVA